MIEPAIHTTKLTKVYRNALTRTRRAAVQDLNLTVNAGEIVGLLGPNGSGKTTTLKMILGLATPSSGQAQIFGKDARLTQSRAEVGFLPENAYFYKFLTGAETLRFHGKLCGWNGQRLETRVRELLELVGLANAGDARLSSYSKGMLQRIGLAQALVHQPNLLVLDEPTASVDPAGSRDICDLLTRLKASGTTILLSSHLLAQVEQICDRIAILHRGRLVREGRVSDVVELRGRTELIIDNASEELVAELHNRIRAADAQLIETRSARTSLEAAFLAATSDTASEE